MAQRPPAQPRRSRSGWSILAILLVGGAVWVFGFTWLIQWIDAPWSIPTLGPTLTGAWEGPLQARQGAMYRLLIEMEYEERGRSSSNLNGHGQICTHHGQTFEFALRGDANRAGDRISLTLAPPGDDRPGPTMTLAGSWRDPTLTLRPDANPFLPDGTFQAVRTISTDDPDDSLAAAELRRGDLTAFEVACRQLVR